LKTSHLDNHPDIATARLNDQKRCVEIELSDAGHEKLKLVSHTILAADIEKAIASEFDMNYPIAFSVSEKYALNFIEGNEWPELLSMRCSATSVELNIWVQQELSWFDGHFPGHPVLAGVVQTHWASTIAQHLFHIKTDFQGVENLKFQRIIEPQTQLLLSLEFSREKQRVLFRYSTADGDYSKGRIRFAPDK